MEKCLLDYFRESAGNDQQHAARVVKTLAKNGIYTMDILMSKTPNELKEIKGIGDKAMHLIGVVMTKEQAIRDNMKDIYDKNCHECPPTSLRAWFQKAGATYLESVNLERILKENGIKTIDVFKKTKLTEFAGYKGVAAKRLGLIAKTKKLMARKGKEK